MQNRKRPDRKAGTGAAAARVAVSGETAATLADELYIARQLLVYTLSYSRVFPPAATANLISDLADFDTSVPHAGRSRLATLRMRYEEAKRLLCPSQEPGARGGGDNTFTREIGEIERHLETMEALIEAAIAVSGAPGPAG